MRLALIICLFLILGAPSYAEMPPPLPHFFHGDVIGSGLGARIEVRNAQGTPYVRTTPLYYRATLVYSLDVSAAYDSVPGGTEGEVLTFYVDLLPAAPAEWHSGRPERLNLYPEGGDTATPTSTETASLRLVLDAPSAPAEDNDRGEWRICYRREGRIVFCVTIEAGQSIEVILRTLGQ